MGKDGSNMVSESARQKEYYMLQASGYDSRSLTGEVLKAGLLLCLWSLGDPVQYSNFH